MTFESVLAWLSENQTCPSVSIAAIMESLGVIELSFMFPRPFRGAQVLRMKLDSLSQVSSTLMTLVLVSSSGSMMRAYYCLRTTDLSVLVPDASFLVLMKLNSHTSFIIR